MKKRLYLLLVALPMLWGCEPDLSTPLSITVKCQVSDVAPYTALLKGEVICSQKGIESSIRSKGFCFNTSPHPIQYTGGGTTETVSADSNIFTSKTVLLPRTTYYIRAFVSTSAGDIYSNEVVVTVPSNVP